MLEVPFQVVHRGGKHWILINGGPTAITVEPNQTLVNAVIQAYQWQKQLLNGKVESIKELARREGVHTRYMMRIQRLSFLAPDIIEAILNGTQPAAMTLERFRCPIPFDWSKQRRLFGFAPI